MINVTKTFLPPKSEYEFFLNKIWEGNQLTNRGDLTLDLENKLKSYLNVRNLFITNNGTLPLQIALNKLGLRGEVITTPFSYIATTSSIVWSSCKPVFVDIDSQYLSIDESKIEAAITPRTTAILATHVFGNPCNVDFIEEIAKKYKIAVIYDAAHCFGVKFYNNSIFNYGDVSTCSFHATKLFHTGEGGAVFCNNDNLFKELFFRHNFGHNGPEEFICLGINAKISELQSAMGLAVLPYIEEIINGRKEVVDYYNFNLTTYGIQKLKIRQGTSWNYSYYPIIFDSEEICLKIISQLNQKKIFPRRYFFPSLNTLEFYEYQCMPVSERISKRIICLPLYYGLTKIDLELIVDTINEILKVK